jgi:hypothetical protein
VRSYTLKEGYLFLALMAVGGIYQLQQIGGPRASAPNSPAHVHETRRVRVQPGPEITLLRLRQFLMVPARYQASWQSSNRKRAIPGTDR